MPMTEPIAEVAPQIRLLTGAGEDIDFAGMESMKIRLQLGSADEMTITLPAQDNEGAWRSDMPIWQVGASMDVEAGYDGEFHFIQWFEVVSTTVVYGEDEGGEMMTVRAVSELARAARYKESRTFDSGSDMDVLTQICEAYGWTNKVSAPLIDPKERLKENGISDLTLLRTIAKEAQVGGPRVTKDRELVMPEPEIGDLKFTRGQPLGTGEFRRLHTLTMNRDGSSPTTVLIIALDPAKAEFVEVEYQADEFGGDPNIVYEGPVSTKELEKEATTQGLTLAVVAHSGQDKRERIDVLSTGRFYDETDGAELAKRWFELREKLSRWADATVDGHQDLLPYTSVELDGSLSAMDRGIWLPIVVEHNFNSSGWLSMLRVIRVVEEAVVSPST